MKKGVMLIAIAFAFAIFGGSAGAAIIFTDNFDRPSYPNNNIDNGWTKTENNPGDVQIRFGGSPLPEGELWMRDVNASVTNSDSTVLFTNIQFTVKYNGNAKSDSSDKLRFGWSDGPGPLTLLPTALDLGKTPSLKTFTFDLPAAAENLADFKFGLLTQVDGSTDAAKIREVTLSGNPTPVPGAVWLLGSGLVCLVGVRKKLKK
jgi:hypothetical protein